MYDAAGKLLGEYDRNGNPIQETVYLGDMPVVVLKQEQGVTVPYYIHTDHINTPRKGECVVRYFTLCEGNAA